MFNVVLVNPEIPPNTGNTGRLCLATGSRLHLVGPLGFSLDDRALKRAGLDYWKEVEVSVWEDLDALLAGIPEENTFHLLSTKARRPYHRARFRPGDYLVFGRETKGLPESLLARYADQTLTIPMPGEKARSLNLATAVAIVLFEAVRQQEVPAP